MIPIRKQIINNKQKGVCQNAHLLFLWTKPRLSQAGALLLPKDFVSLSIQILLWQRYIIVLTFPIKQCYFLKELMSILQKTILCAWLTLWLKAWILKVSGSYIKNAVAALTIPRWCSRSFCMPIWTTSTPAGIDQHADQGIQQALDQSERHIEDDQALDKAVDL